MCQTVTGRLGPPGAGPRDGPCGVCTTTTSQDARPTTSCVVLCLVCVNIWAPQRAHKRPGPGLLGFQPSQTGECSSSRQVAISVSLLSRSSLLSEDNVSLSTGTISSTVSY